VHITRLLVGRVFPCLLRIVVVGPGDPRWPVPALLPRQPP